VRFIKALLVLLQVAAPFLLVSKCTVLAGALHTIRKQAKLAPL